MSDNSRMLEKAHKASEALTLISQILINYRNTLMTGGFSADTAESMCAHMHDTLMHQMSRSQTS